MLPGVPLRCRTSFPLIHGATGDWVSVAEMMHQREFVEKRRKIWKEGVNIGLFEWSAERICTNESGCTPVKRMDHCPFYFKGGQRR